MQSPPPNAPNAPRGVISFGEREPRAHAVGMVGLITAWRRPSGVPVAPQLIQWSVAPAGRAWVERFDRCLRDASSVRFATDDAYLGDDVLFRYAPELAMMPAAKNYGRLRMYRLRRRHRVGAATSA